MSNFYNSLRNLDESLLLEYNRKDLRNWAGDEAAADFFSIRDRLNSPENDLGYWIKQGDLPKFKDFINKYKSGEIKSKSQEKKEDKINGADLVYSDKNWKVYFVKTYNAAKLLGSGTTWCITGRYHGAESQGKYYFDRYVRDYNLNNGKDNGYYFIFDLNHRDPTTGDYLKYCAGVKNGNTLSFLYNGMQDSEISKTGIPNIDPENRIQPIPGITLPYFDIFKTDGDKLITINDKYVVTVDIPKYIKIICRDAFAEMMYLTNVNLNNVEEIQVGAFKGCTLLKNINDTNIITEKVKKIEAGAFFDTGLQSITLPATISKIDKYTFGYCEKLTDLYLSPNVNYDIDDHAFDGCKEVTIHNNISDYIKSYVLKHDNLKLDNDITDPETGEVLN